MTTLIHVALTRRRALRMNGGNTAWRTTVTCNNAIQVTIYSCRNCWPTVPLGRPAQRDEGSSEHGERGVRAVLTHNDGQANEVL
jgi:hypothetical protein